MVKALLLGLMFACAGCSDNGGGPGNVDCGYLDANNDPQCPTRYGDVCIPVSQRTCSTPGLACAYPGAGDGPDSHGCFATAMAWCKVPPGADGGLTKWVCAQ
jgi:hypothetical protein